MADLIKANDGHIDVKNRNSVPLKKARSLFYFCEERPSQNLSSSNTISLQGLSITAGLDGRILAFREIDRRQIWYFQAPPGIYLLGVYKRMLTLRTQTEFGEKWWGLDVSDGICHWSCCILSKSKNFINDNETSYSRDSQGFLISNTTDWITLPGASLKPGQAAGLIPAARATAPHGLRMGLDGEFLFFACSQNKHSFNIEILENSYLGQDIPALRMEYFQDRRVGALPLSCLPMGFFTARIRMKEGASMLLPFTWSR